jgi:hypothetical protein
MLLARTGQWYMAMYRDTQADQVVICGLRHHVQLHGFGHDFFFFKLFGVQTQNISF